MKINRWIVRDIEAADSLEVFLVSAVSAILGIRFYLYLTDYPQIGGGGLHIAHMLWGGLLMLMSMIVLLSVLNRSAHRVAALIGGLGFGTFVDELGKFITRDNNYFFAPTVAIIYVIFVVLYLVFRMIDRNIKPTPKEYLINTLSFVQEAIAWDLDTEEMERARRYLRKSGRTNEQIELVEKLLSTSSVNTVSKSEFFEQLKIKGQKVYQKIVRQSLFRVVLILLFAVQAAIGLSESVIISNFIAQNVPSFGVQIEKTSVFKDYGYLLSVGLANMLVIAGVAELFRSRLKAYQIFKFAILVSILLVQFFDFLTFQFGALWSFGYNLVMLTVLNTLIENEKIMTRDE